RLIEKGAIVEKLQGIDAENIKPENTQEWLINNLTDLTDHFTGELPAEFFEYNILQKELDDLKQKVNSLNNELTFCFKSRSEEHTSKLQSRYDIVCRLLL